MNDHIVFFPDIFPKVKFRGQCVLNDGRDAEDGGVEYSGTGAQALNEELRDNNPILEKGTGLDFFCEDERTEGLSWIQEFETDMENQGHGRSIELRGGRASDGGERLIGHEALSQRPTGLDDKSTAPLLHSVCPLIAFRTWAGKS